MWNKYAEDEEHRKRRISLVRSGMSHPEVDRLFEKEEMKQIIEESFEKTKEALAEQLDLAIKELRESTEIEFREKQKLLSKSLKGLENVDKRYKERDAQIKAVYEKFDRLLKQAEKFQKEYEEKYEEVLKEKIERLDKAYEDLKEIEAKYLKSYEATEKERGFYIEEAKKYNELIAKLNEKYLELDKRIKRYNNELRRLRG